MTSYVPFSFDQSIASSPLCAHSVANCQQPAVCRNFGRFVIFGVHVLKPMSGGAGYGNCGARGRRERRNKTRNLAEGDLRRI